MTYGLQIGWVSPMSTVLQSDSSPTGNVLSTTAISWIGSITPLAASFGVQLFGYLADSYGRKPAVLALSVPQAVSIFFFYSIVFLFIFMNFSLITKDF